MHVSLKYERGVAVSGLMASIPVHIVVSDQARTETEVVICNFLRVMMRDKRSV
jgi:hypothetical protein